MMQMIRMEVEWDEDEPGVLTISYVESVGWRSCVIVCVVGGGAQC